MTEDMTNVTPVKGGGNHNAADSSYMSLSGLPQHIKNELVAIAKVAPDDSPLKTGEFWSWLERSPEKGSSKSVEMEVSQDEEGRREDEGGRARGSGGDESIWRCIQALCGYTRVYLRDLSWNIGDM